MDRFLVIVMMIIFTLILIGFIGYQLYCIVDAKHFRVVMTNYKFIMDAIYSYRLDMHHRGVTPEVEYEDMVEINILYKRFFDWSYKHILPPDKFKLIEKYIDD